MYIKWLEDFVNDNIRYMTEEQLSHFRECAIKLNGNDNLIEAFDKYSYNDFIQLGILDCEEVQILDNIIDEIAYMKEDDDSADSNTSTDYEELKKTLNNREILLVDYKLHGDSGVPIVSLFFDSNINKWIYQKPVERCNRVIQKEFDTFEDARKFIENVVV